jgi:hypothetical protein
MGKIEDLRRRNAELEKENASLRSPAPRRFPGRAGALLVMPDERSLRELAALTLSAYPILKPYDPTKSNAFQRMFDNSFFALGRVPRHPESKLNSQFDKSVWTGRAETVLGNAGCLSTEINLASFCAAVVAHHDIAHSPFGRWPFDLEFGLGNFTGAEATDKWRELLASRKVRAPTPLPVTRQIAAPSQVQVRLLGFGELKNHF